MIKNIIFDIGNVVLDFNLLNVLSSFTEKRRTKVYIR